MPEESTGPIELDQSPVENEKAVFSSSSSIPVSPTPATSASENATASGMDFRHGDQMDAIVPGDDDDMMDDEGYGTSEAGSFMSSILSSVRRGVQENGRIYPSFGKHFYGIPIDEKELDRNDFQHHKFLLLFENKLYLAPIPDSALQKPDSRILDLGTGTGVWAIEMADKFPNAETIGNDIAATQPPYVPPNCIFEIEDVEADWPYPPDHFDFIHGREFLYSIRNWPRLISQAHEALKPGGWLQLACTVPEVRCDDDTIPGKSAMKEAADMFIEMGARMGTSPLEARKWKQNLIDAGYVNVEEVVLKIPTSPWPRDSRLRSVGAIERAMLSEGLHAMMLRGWTQILGRKIEDLAVFTELAVRELRDTSIHIYCDFHVAYGQKP